MIHRTLLFALLIASTVLFSRCSTLSAVNAASVGIKLAQAATISDEYVKGYVSQYVAELDKENEVATGNDPYNVRIQRITAPFNNKYGINVKVYKSPQANAFATADGSVRVYSGLMDIMTDEELLGVMGHEIGHYINHDTRDAFRNALVTSAIRDGLSSTTGVVGTLSASQFGDLAESLSSSQYSQKQEREADQYGYKFLKENGINPWAMAMAFEKLLELENRSGASRTPGLQQLFSTHPDLKSRAETMARQAAKDGYTRPANK